MAHRCTHRQQGDYPRQLSQSISDSFFVHRMMSRSEEKVPKKSLLQQINLRCLICLVQMFSGRQLRKFFQMLRPQWIRNGVFLTEPFSQIHQLASTRAKRPMRSCEPLPHPPARRAFHIETLFHSEKPSIVFQRRQFNAYFGFTSSTTDFKSAATAAASSLDAPPASRLDCTSLIIVSLWSGGVFALFNNTATFRAR